MSRDRPTCSCRPQAALPSPSTGRAAGGGAFKEPHGCRALLYAAPRRFRPAATASRMRPAARSAPCRAGGHGRVGRGSTWGLRAALGSAELVGRALHARPAGRDARLHAHRAGRSTPCTLEALGLARSQFWCYQGVRWRQQGSHTGADG